MKTLFTSLLLMIATQSLSQDTTSILRVQKIETQLNSASFFFQKSAKQKELALITSIAGSIFTGIMYHQFQKSKSNPYTTYGNNVYVKNPSAFQTLYVMGASITTLATLSLSISSHKNFKLGSISLGKSK